MIDIRIEEDNGIRRFRVGGSLTIEHAEEIWQLLSGTPDDTRDSILCLEDVTGADVSCLQLICSAHRACEAKNKLLAFDGKQSKVFMAAARKAGFVEYTCGVAKETTLCLWRGAENE